MTIQIEPFQWLLAHQPVSDQDLQSVRHVYDGVGQHNRLLIFKSHDFGNSTIYLMVRIPLVPDVDSADMELRQNHSDISWCFVVGNWEFESILLCAREISTRRAYVEEHGLHDRDLTSNRIKRKWAVGTLFAQMNIVREMGCSLRVNFKCQMPLAFGGGGPTSFKETTAKWLIGFSDEIDRWDFIGLLNAVPDDVTHWPRLRSPCWIDEHMGDMEDAQDFARYLRAHTTDERLLAVADIANTLAGPANWDGRIRASFFIAPRDVYLNVSYELKEWAKECGARWDPEARSWFMPAGGSLKNVINWMKSEDLHLVHPKIIDKSQIEHTPSERPS